MQTFKHKAELTWVFLEFNLSVGHRISVLGANIFATRLHKLSLKLYMYNSSRSIKDAPLLCPYAECSWIYIPLPSLHGADIRVIKCSWWTGMQNGDFDFANNFTMSLKIRSFGSRKYQEKVESWWFSWTWLSKKAWLTVCSKANALSCFTFFKIHDMIQCGLRLILIKKLTVFECYW